MAEVTVRIVKHAVNPGEKYGKLTIIGEVRKVAPGGKSYRAVRCRCDCGNELTGAPPTFRTADPLGSSAGKDQLMPGKYKTYSPEFRDEAARLVVETSRAIADVARELGISETSLGNWVRAYRQKHAEEEPPLQVSERARLRELERRNRELEMELAFLKKAAAYFAREPR